MYRVYIVINIYWYFVLIYRYIIFIVMDLRKMRKIFFLFFCCIMKLYLNFIKLLLLYVYGIKLNGFNGVCKLL